MDDDAELQQLRERAQGEAERASEVRPTTITALIIIYILLMLIISIITTSLLTLSQQRDGLATSPLLYSAL
ncbi:hypothetical protein Q1695_000588 [Nippostrongylus brasiliensis]|nr:hypothetical protein Q1695_000588 [Nippostrongylus brasiliensis]